MWLLSLYAKHTHGHSLGGVTYVIGGLESPVAIVGDAIFADPWAAGWFPTKMLCGRIGKIMTLPDDTVLAETWTNNHCR